MTAVRAGWRPRSVRFRITVLAVGVMAGLLLVTGIFVVSDHRNRLTDQIDDLVEQRAAAIVDLVEAGPIPDPLPGEDGRDSLAQLVAADGSVVSASPNMSGRPALPYTPAKDDHPRLRTVEDVPIEDDDFRILTQRFRGPDGARYVLHVGLEFEVAESAESLARTLAVGFPSVLVVLAALIWAVVGRALRPVESIRAEVAAITSAELGRRVTVPAGGDEISRLAATMNGMLEHLEESHRRQQRFVADASHELRSPLTGIRSEIEVDLAHPDSADHEATARSVLEETGRLSRLVDSLLFLASADAVALSPVVAAVDLDEIVLREAAAIRLTRAVTIDTTAVSGAQVHGDADLLRRAVRNLLDNASRHATSTVTVALAEADEGVALTVADDGPGVDPEAAARIFERFVRTDEARARDRGGAGLGLAITAEIVAHHGGTIALTAATPGGGARFVARFPLR